MPEYVRVQDRKSGAKYSVVASAVRKDAHTVLRDEPATRIDGTPLPGERGAKSYADQTVDELKAEIDARNAGRDGVAHISKSGNKATLVAALTADDAPRVPVEQESDGQKAEPEKES